MNSNTNILTKMPWDIKLEIATYLNVIDIYNLTLIDKNFEDILRNGKECTLDFSFDFRLDYKTVSNVLKIVGADKVTGINFNGVYWLNVTELKNVLRRLPNLKIAYLYGTKLNINNHMLSTFKEGTVFYMCPPFVESTSCAYSSLRYLLKFSSIQKKEQSSHSVLLYKPVNIIERHIFAFSNIHDVNWLKDFRVLPGKSEVEYLESTNANRIAKGLDELDEKYFDRLCERNPNIEEVIIYKGIKGNFPKLSLKQLGALKNLRKLSVEVTMNLQFLDTIFSECKHLKFLRILSHIPQFRITHLRNAQSLEDLSLELNGTLDLENLLMELGDNGRVKMRRILLKFRHFNRLSKKILAEFLKANQQLIVFAVYTGMTDTSMKSLTKHVQTYCDSPVKQYFFRKVQPEVHVMTDLYCMHYDLVGAYIN